jgi:hypothetical protein
MRPEGGFSIEKLWPLKILQIGQSALPIELLYKQYFRITDEQTQKRADSDKRDLKTASDSKYSGKANSKKCPLRCA